MRTKIKITGRFATAEDTARVLGVPKSQLKWLKSLVAARVNGAGENGRTQPKRSKKATASRKKQARAAQGS